MDYGRETAAPERPVFHVLEPRLLLSDTMFGPPQGVSLSTDGPVCAYATDLDGDGDADVLSASLGAGLWYINQDKIAWYENLGGGAFSAQRVISTAADAAASVYATDLDGDGDADVLSASWNDDKIAWYKNLSLRANGDANDDGVVDDNDLSLLLSHWGQNVTGDPNGGWAKGEFSGSAPVNDDDLSLLLANWTGAGGGFSGGSTSVLPAVQGTEERSPDTGPVVSAGDGSRERAWRTPGASPRQPMWASPKSARSPCRRRRDTSTSLPSPAERYTRRSVWGLTKSP